MLPAYRATHRLELHFTLTIRLLLSSKVQGQCSLLIDTCPVFPAPEPFPLLKTHSYFIVLNSGQITIYLALWLFRFQTYLDRKIINCPLVQNNTSINETSQSMCERITCVMQSGVLFRKKTHFHIPLSVLLLTRLFI